MTTIQLIKKHLPSIKNSHRKGLAQQIDLTSKITKKTAIEIILKMEQEVNKQGKKDSFILMCKIIVTGLLIEINDELEGTLFHRYYCKITAGVGKRFMNAQYNIYQKEYNDLLTTKFNDTSYLTETVNRAVKILAKVIRTGEESNLELFEAMQNDEVLMKRMHGIYKQHLKQNKDLTNQFNSIKLK